MEEVVALEQAMAGLPLGSFTAPERTIGVAVGVSACREDEVLDIRLPLLGMQCSITGPALPRCSTLFCSSFPSDKHARVFFRSYSHDDSNNSSAATGVQ